MDFEGKKVTLEWKKIYIRMFEIFLNPTGFSLTEDQWESRSKQMGVMGG